MDEKTTLVNNNEFINTLKQMKESGNSDDLLWAYIIRDQSGEMLSEDLVKQLIESGICLDRLAHLPLNDNCLIKLFQKDPRLCREAGLTLINNYLQDCVTIESFKLIFSSCCDEYTSEYLFHIMLLNHDYSDLRIKKYQEGINLIKQKYSHESLIYQYAIQYEIFLKLLFTDDIKYILEKYEIRSEIFYMALSLNKNTPKDIIEELVCLKGMKYANLIRNNARKQG